MSQDLGPYLSFLCFDISFTFRSISMILFVGWRTQCKIERERVPLPGRLRASVQAQRRGGVHEQRPAGGGDPGQPGHQILRRYLIFIRPFFLS